MFALYVFFGFFVLIILFFLSAKPVDVQPAAENDEDIKHLAVNGHKMTAIKEYRRLHGGSLADAKRAVEMMLRNEPVSEDTKDKISEIKRLVRRGEKIAAIKVYREHYGVGLKEAKESVELMMEDEI